MDFTIPKHITDLLGKIDEFIDSEIKPLQAQDDNERFFDHRREWARTDFEHGGLPRKEWEALLGEMRRRADKAGFLRMALPEEFGGKNIGNLAMAIIREHLATKGLGLHNDLQNETSVVGNFPQVLMFRDFGTDEQKKTILPGMLAGKMRIAFALTEPKHGSDATWMETRAVKDGNGWRINGEKMWNTGVHAATHDMVFVRTSGNDGDARGLTCFIVPMNAEGVKIEEYMWTFNMPTDHARVSFKNVWVPDDAIFGPVDNGLVLARHFVHENRIRQAASGVGAAQYCINESVDYANTRKPFGKPLSRNQAIQWPLVELQTECEMIRWLIYRTAWEMDRMTGPEIQLYLSDKVSMCNYRGNRLVCDAADWAMQVHGGWGYSRHKQFEHIYRHHRRYRITEGSEEIQKRNVAGHMFGFIGKNRPRGILMVLNIAHRGGAGLWPENTLGAFSRAIAMGADGAELDVQLSRDGEVVVFHDYRLKPEICRGPNGRWLTRPTPLIKDLTVAELKRYDVGRPDGGKGYGTRYPNLTPMDGERIPTLTEVLSVCATAKKPFHLFVELKTSWADRSISAGPEELVEATVAVLRKANYLDRTVFVGFDWPGLLHAGKVAPDTKRWFTTIAQSWFRDDPPPPEDDPPAEAALNMLRHLAKTGTSPWAGGFDAVNYGGSIVKAIKAAGGDGWFPMYRDATPAMVKEAQELGLEVGAWTVDERGEMNELVHLGLTGICTDRPDLLSDVLAGVTA